MMTLILHSPLTSCLRGACSFLQKEIDMNNITELSLARIKKLNEKLQIG